MSSWHGGKGSGKRPCRVSQEIFRLRDSLWREKDPVKKEEIRNKIAELEGKKPTVTMADGYSYSENGCVYDHKGNKV